MEFKVTAWHDRKRHKEPCDVNIRDRKSVKLKI